MTFGKVSGKAVRECRMKCIGQKEDPLRTPSPSGSQTFPTTLSNAFAKSTVIWLGSFDTSLVSTDGVLMS